MYHTNEPSSAEVEVQLENHPDLNRFLIQVQNQINLKTVQLASTASKSEAALVADLVTAI